VSARLVKVASIAVEEIVLVVVMVAVDSAADAKFSVL
jgi:hypothetical protein